MIRCSSSELTRPVGEAGARSRRRRRHLGKVTPDGREEPVGGNRPREMEGTSPAVHRAPAWVRAERLELSRTSPSSGSRSGWVSRLPPPACGRVRHVVTARSFSRQSIRFSKSHLGARHQAHLRIGLVTLAGAARNLTPHGRRAKPPDDRRPRLPSDVLPARKTKSRLPGEAAPRRSPDFESPGHPVKGASMARLAHPMALSAYPWVGTDTARHDVAGVRAPPKRRSTRLCVAC